MKLVTGTPKEIKRIFIVEDNGVYANSLEAFLKDHFPQLKEIRIFRIGEMCMLELDRNPDLIIMDYFLNTEYQEANNGLEIIKRIKLLNADIHIIVLSRQKKISVILESIKQYNCFYVQKDAKAFTRVANFIKELSIQKIPPPFAPSTS